MGVNYAEFIPVDFHVIRFEIIIVKCSPILSDVLGINECSVLMDVTSMSLLCIIIKWLQWLEYYQSIR